MIGFLKELGFSEKTLSDIILNNDDSILYSVSLNEQNIEKIIKYMRNIGIKNIDSILIYHIEIFILTFSDFIKKISKFNIPLLVESINEDYNNISLLSGAKDSR